MNTAQLLGLRSRIFLLLGVLLLLSLGGALATLWYAQQSQHVFAQRLALGTDKIIAAEEMQGALASQQGAVTSYILERDPQWLAVLDEQGDAFGTWWRRALDLANEEEARSHLFALDNAYVRYEILHRRLLAEGSTPPVERLVVLKQRFLAALEACIAFKIRQQVRMKELLRQYNARTDRLQLYAWSTIPVAALMAILLAVVLLRQVLRPIQSLAQELSKHLDAASIRGGEPATFSSYDEVSALREKVELLLTDVGAVRNKLAKSRENLAQSEKLALIGKLAAGVAHSVRNPLTSVKMRLFTLERSLHLTADSKEDFGVINEEIHVIDNILKNFLEFSRPPQIKPRLISPSTVVDQACQLLKYRFDHMGVKVRIARNATLPTIMGDPDQLKEAIVNLLINAMDAMSAAPSQQSSHGELGNGGSIRISEEVGKLEPYGAVAILRIVDTGPGIEPSVMATLFEPFITTKEEGVGLGLAIAKQIIEEHGGWIHATAEPHLKQGATFVIGLPISDHTA